MSVTTTSAKQATTVLCFGDSWTDGNAAGLREQIKKNDLYNVRVINTDYWGSTAEQFANKPQLLPQTVTKWDADYVLLSMGGNDFKNIYLRNKQYVTPWTAVSGIEKNIRIVLDALFAAHPNVKVVMYGYDFPGSVDQFLSWANDEDLSSSLKVLMWLYNMVGVRVINYSAMQLGYSLEKLSKEFTKKGFSFTYVPLWGSLQSAAKQREAVSVSMGKPSPDAYMADPIHANREGFNILLGNLYNAYFGKALTAAAS